MTVELAPSEVAGRLRDQFPALVLEAGPNWLAFGGKDVLRVCRFLYEDPDLNFVYLVGLTCVDWLDYFEVVYHLQSLRRNHIVAIKARVDHDAPTLPSVTGIWYGAYLQEMEVYD